MSLASALQRHSLQRASEQREKRAQGIARDMGMFYDGLMYVEQAIGGAPGSVPEKKIFTGQGCSAEELASFAVDGDYGLARLAYDERSDSLWIEPLEVGAFMDLLAEMKCLGITDAYFSLLENGELGSVALRVPPMVGVAAAFGMRELLEEGASVGRGLSECFEKFAEGETHPFSMDCGDGWRARIQAYSKFSLPMEEGVKAVMAVRLLSAGQAGAGLARLAYLERHFYPALCAKAARAIGNCAAAGNSGQRACAGRI